MKSAKDIRQDFISFFEDKDHRFVRSSPVVPLDDPTLLFANAGMNQFKPIFLGQQKPAANRVVNSQKCIRVSGKHNDLEEVGVDNYHHTFFEMLGNWSFGDYYKAEAIRWGWELLTNVWGMDKSRFWATVHTSDDEAADLWPQVTDIAPERVLRFGDKDNFWEMGETGPCGPCSEIHYYDGPDINQMTAEGVNVLPEYKELWNLVFIQNNRKEDGSLDDLPDKHVDTGAGLERIVAVLQGTDSNYQTDLFTPILDHIVEITGIPYSEETGVPHQVLADHVRMLSFSLADGVLPSNEGRGYVLRRILRRGARFGRILEQHDPFIYRLVDTVVDIMGEAYPELIEKKDHIQKVIRAEEKAFGETLDRGIEVFERTTAKMKPGDTIDGDDAFKLYDTYGFPLDLTQLMAREKELQVDDQGFDAAMSRQKERARKGQRAAIDEDDVPWITLGEMETSDFLGYDTTASEATIVRLRQTGSDAWEVVLSQTPFYAESGGQIGDTGTLEGDGFLLEVKDTQKSLIEGHEEIVHLCKGSLPVEVDKALMVTAKVDLERRQAIRLNHTATHLMHQALKDVLGDHVQQAGSLVAPDRLRFDLTHYDKITPAQVAEIELSVNRIIRENRPLDVKIMPFDKARKDGAVAIFGEKYGDEVRVVDVPGFSKELCGGTHVDRTGDIGYFKIVHESALAAGVRRIEAVTGESIAQYIGQVEAQLEQERKEHRERIKALEKQLKAATKGHAKDLANEMLAVAQEGPGFKIVAARVELTDKDQFRDLAVDIKHRLKSAVVVLATVMNDKPQVVVAVSDDVKDRLPAGRLVKDLGERLGGGGGGSPILATAGGKDIHLVEQTLADVPKMIDKLLKS